MTVRYSAMVESAAGNGARVILICRDTTTSKEAEHEREASRHMVALAEMATVLAHEIRNPLGSMELLTGLLAGRRRTERGLQTMRSALAGRSTLAVGGREQCACASTVQAASNLQPTKLAEAVAQRGQFCSATGEAERNHAQPATDSGVGRDRGDAGGLQQVILNLVCNALRHTSAGGNITVAGACRVPGRSAESLWLRLPTLAMAFAPRIFLTSLSPDSAPASKAQAWG